jgi:hypothetical protein
VGGGGGSAAAGSLTGAGGSNSTGGISSGIGACFHLWLHFAQRTLRPFGPKRAASNANRVAQAGQLTITTRYLS